MLKRDEDQRTFIDVSPGAPGALHPSKTNDAERSYLQAIHVEWEVRERNELASEIIKRKEELGAPIRHAVDYFHEFVTQRPFITDQMTLYSNSSKVLAAGSDVANLPQEIQSLLEQRFGVKQGDSQSPEGRKQNLLAAAVRLENEAGRLGEKLELGIHRVVTSAQHLLGHLGKLVDKGLLYAEQVEKAVELAEQFSEGTFSVSMLTESDLLPFDELIKSFDHERCPQFDCKSASIAEHPRTLIFELLINSEDPSSPLVQEKTQKLIRNCSFDDYICQISLLLSVDFQGDSRCDDYLAKVEPSIQQGYLLSEKLTELFELDEKEARQLVGSFSQERISVYNDLLQVVESSQPIFHCVVDGGMEALLDTPELYAPLLAEVEVLSKTLEEGNPTAFFKICLEEPGTAEVLPILREAVAELENPEAKKERDLRVTIHQIGESLAELHKAELSITDIAAGAVLSVGFYRAGKSFKSSSGRHQNQLISKTRETLHAEEGEILEAVESLCDLGVIVRDGKILRVSSEERFGELLDKVIVAHELIESQRKADRHAKKTPKKARSTEDVISIPSLEVGCEQVLDSIRSLPKDHAALQRVVLNLNELEGMCDNATAQILEFGTMHLSFSNYRHKATRGLINEVNGPVRRSSRRSEKKVRLQRVNDYKAKLEKKHKRELDTILSPLVRQAEGVLRFLSAVSEEDSSGIEVASLSSALQQLLEPLKSKEALPRAETVSEWLEQESETPLHRLFKLLS